MRDAGVPAVQCGRRARDRRASGSDAPRRRAAPTAPRDRSHARTARACHTPRVGLRVDGEEPSKEAELRVEELRGADRGGPTRRTTCSTRPRSPTPTTTSWSASSQQLEEQFPELRTRGLADANGRGGAVRVVHAGRAHRADDVARQRDEPRGARGVGQADGAASISEPMTFVCEPKIDGVAMSLRFEQGRVRARRDARRRPRRRRRHRQRGDADVDPEAARGRRTCPTCFEVRGEVYMPVASFTELNERQEAAGATLLRQPAQRGGRLVAPEGPGRSPPAASSASSLPTRRDRRRPGVQGAPGDARRTCATPGCPVNDIIEAVDSLDCRPRRTARSASRTGTRCRTRSTASS